MLNDQLKEYIYRQKSINDHSKIHDYVESINKTDDISKDKEKLNYDYIYWLERFTRIYPLFSNADWIYDSSSLNEEDVKNLNNIASIFKVIAYYAKENDIKTKETRYGLSYYVKYDDIGYKISTYCNQIYCQRLEAKDNYIDLNKLINESLTENDEYKTKLLTLDNELLNAFNEGIPVDYIEKHISKTLKKIRNN